MPLIDRAVVMGILNVTPDSFSDGGRFSGRQQALEHALCMIHEGAQIIDVGGESTRPGAPPVSTEEELRRVIPIIELIRQNWDGWISIDTSKARVAGAALEAGADIVNDVTGLRGDPEMEATCACAGCAVVVMHMQGSPKNMQANPQYENVVSEVGSFFHQRLESLRVAGIEKESIVFDPGIGFGKTVEHNLTLLRGLGEIPSAGRPVLLGASRKSFIGAVLGDLDPALRSWPSVAVTAFAREQGVLLHRVHEVRKNREALRMVEAILG